MSTRGKLSLLVALVAARGAFCADFAMAGVDPQRTGATAERVAPPLALVWQFATDEDTGLTASPVIVGNRVYFCALGVVYCLDAETGSIIWEFDTKFDIRMSPMLAGGTLVVGNDNGELFFLDAAAQPEGERLKGVVDFGAPLRCDPVLSGDQLYLVDDNGKLFTVGLADYKETQIGAFRSQPKGNLAWDGKEALYLTGRDNLVHCWDLRRKRLAWAQSAGAMVSPVIVVDGAPVVATRTGIVALRPGTGRAAWTVRGFEAGRGTPATGGGKIFVAGRDENLYAIDLTTRKVAGVVEMDSPVESALTVADDKLYMGTGAGNLYAIDTATLAFEWYYRTSPTDTVGPDKKQFAINIPPAVANGGVYVVSEKGSLFAFRADAFDVGKPKIYQPQLVTNAVDNTLVDFDMVDDELRQLLIDEAEDAAPEGQEAEVPKDAEMVKVPGRQPTFRFEAFIYDEGSGVPLDKMVIKWNGEPHESSLMKVTPNDYLLTVDLLKPAEGARVQQLRQGKHTIEITVPDFKGNTLTRVYTFEIDNNLPPIEPPKTETTGGPGVLGPGGAGSAGLPGPGGAGFPGPAGPGGPVDQ